MGLSLAAGEQGLPFLVVLGLLMEVASLVELSALEHSSCGRA